MTIDKVISDREELMNIGVPNSYIDPLLEIIQSLRDDYVRRSQKTNYDLIDNSLDNVKLAITTLEDEGFTYDQITQIVYTEQGRLLPQDFSRVYQFFRHANFSEYLALNLALDSSYWAQLEQVAARCDMIRDLFNIWRIPEDPRDDYTLALLDNPDIWYDTECIVRGYFVGVSNEEVEQTYDRLISHQFDDRLQCPEHIARRLSIIPEVRRLISTLFFANVALFIRRYTEEFGFKQTDWDKVVELASSPDYLKQPDVFIRDLAEAKLTQY